MIELYVTGQSIKLYTPVIAADALHWLTAKVHFTDGQWDDSAKWLHFRRGEGTEATVYDLALDENDEVTKEKELSLTIGEWEIHLTGTRGEERLTTVPVILTVKRSGLVDAPLHPMPLSVAEQVDSKAETALRLARELKAAADRGDLDGADGKSLVIAGFYDTASELAQAVPQPEKGEAYGIGTAAPYDIYVWDEVNGRWRNAGSFLSAPGDKGENGEPGATFIPYIDAAGNISWTNDAGLENPETRNIIGPVGPIGQAGRDGKSPYEAAVEAGYTGTEATFYAALVSIPYHNARHLPDGADPIQVKTGNLENGSVTQEKLAQAAVGEDQIKTGTVSATYRGILLANAWTRPESGGPWQQVLSIEGIRAADEPIVDLDWPVGTLFDVVQLRVDEYAKIHRASARSGSVVFRAYAEPTVDLPVKMLCIRK